MAASERALIKGQAGLLALTQLDHVCLELTLEPGEQLLISLSEAVCEQAAKLYGAADRSPFPLCTQLYFRAHKYGASTPRQALSCRDGR